MQPESVVRQGFGRLLTRNVVAVGDGDINEIPFGAAIWGLARALRAERPDLRVTTVDVENDRLLEASAFRRWSDS